jgi:hypothetical protein
LVKKGIFPDSIEVEENIDLPNCKLNDKTGEVICKVDSILYNKIRKGAIVNKITFEVETIKEG